MCVKKNKVEMMDGESSLMIDLIGQYVVRTGD